MAINGLHPEYQELLERHFEGQTLSPEQSRDLHRHALRDSMNRLLAQTMVAQHTSPNETRSEFVDL